MGIATLEFEKKTEMQDGFLVSRTEFEEIARSEMQLVDGDLEITLQGNIGTVLVQCCDSTFWEILTTSNEIKNLLYANGFIHK